MLKQKWVLILILLTSWGCATSEQFKNLPPNRNAISSVLPEGTSSWRSLAGFTPFDADTEKTLTPFMWEQGYSKNLTLVWAPLPFDFRYQFFTPEILGYKSNFILEASVLGSPYSREKHFDWRPLIAIKAHTEFSENFVQEISLFEQFEVRRVGENKLSQQVGVQTQSFFQYKSFGFSLEMRPLFEKGKPKALYLGSLPDFDQTHEEWKFRIPLAFKTRIKFQLQWDALLELQWLKIGYQNFQSFPVYFSIIHYW